MNKRPYGTADDLEPGQIKGAFTIIKLLRTQDMSSKRYSKAVKIYLVKCNRCGVEHEKIGVNMRNGGSGCKSCHREVMSESHKKHASPWEMDQYIRDIAPILARGLLASRVN